MTSRSREPLEPADVRAQVQRILASPQFSNCGRLTRFVSFAAEHALTGSGEQLKEYIIGVEVFDRTPAYDPRIDPIVRVEARRLRSKLDSYYASAGRDDSVLVEFPKGTYTPVFRAMSASPPQLAMTVLPFAALTATGADSSFAAGLTEELVHGLTNLRSLRLVPSDEVRQSNFRLLDAVLRGSVRCELGRVRVISQFIDASSQVYLWSEAFDSCGRNAASPQPIARALVARVEMTLSSFVTQAEDKARLGM